MDNFEIEKVHKKLRIIETVLILQKKIGIFISYSVSGTVEVGAQGAHLRTQYLAMVKWPTVPRNLQKES